MKQLFKFSRNFWTYFFFFFWWRCVLKQAIKTLQVKIKYYIISSFRFRSDVSSARYWNPLTRRDLQLKIFYGVVSSSSYVTRHGTLNADNAGVLTPWTSHMLRKTRNFLELSWWGWWQHCSTVSPGSNIDQVTACCGRIFVFFFLISPSEFRDITLK